MTIVCPGGGGRQDNSLWTPLHRLSNDGRQWGAASSPSASALCFAAIGSALGLPKKCSPTEPDSIPLMLGSSSEESGAQPLTWPTPLPKPSPPRSRYWWRRRKGKWGRTPSPSGLNLMKPFRPHLTGCSRGNSAGKPHSTQPRSGARITLLVQEVSKPSAI
jgi:hypothetical protein